MVAGCHPGECHYLVQNYKTIRRFQLLKHTLAAMGIEDARVRLQWASAAEGQILANAIDEMVEKVRTLGPLEWPHKWREGNGLERLVAEVAAEDARLGPPHPEGAAKPEVRA
jgi:F420-non-reducing hydrogenase iron-sulfur subunit